jgi:outer membrane protein insertion porin family
VRLPALLVLPLLAVGPALAGAQEDPASAPVPPGLDATLAPPSTGVPLVDLLLRRLPFFQEPEPQGPAIPPGEPRPVIGFRFDLADFLNAAYFKDDTLRGFVRHPVGVPADGAQLDADARHVVEEYGARGFLKARVTWSLEPHAPGDTVVFRVEAGSRAQLKAIELVGNQALEPDKLLVGLFHRPVNVFSFTDRGGVYHAGYVGTDLQVIAKNYADHGYLTPVVKGGRAYGNPDGNEIRLRFDVEDGPLFTVGTVVLSGDLPLTPARSMRLLALDPGTPAGVLRVDAAVERLLDLWRDAGFAGARAHRTQRLHPDQPVVDFIIRVEKGTRMRVGKVRVVGSPATFDHVIKRDVVVREGATYSLRALRLSEQRLMYTGLFTKVVLRPAFTDDPDVVDVEIDVSEQQSWYLSLAPSWFPGEGLIGLGLIGFNNAFGQAWRIHAQGVISQLRQTGRVFVEDPRVLDTPLSLSASAHRDRFVYPAYSLIRTGGAGGMGYPLVDRVRLSMTYGLERLDMENSGDLAPYAGTARFPTGKRRGSLSFSATWDQRDNALFPSRGLFLEATVEYGGRLALGEINFLRASANARFYVPLPFGFVLKNNTAAAGVVNPAGGPVPVSERFYEGGPIQTVRGYSFQSIGPTVFLGNPLDPGGERMGVRMGGVSRFLNNVELETPQIPITSLVPVKLFAFADAGNTWSEEERPFFFPHVFLSQRDEVDLPLGLFYSVGVGAMVANPIFPLRLEFSVPLTRRPRDEPINFFMSAGSPF